MFRVTENKDEIIASEIALEAWFYTIVIGLVFGGGTFLGILLLVSNKILALYVSALVFTVAALLYNWNTPATTIKINVPGKTISVKKKSLTGYKFDIYDFEEVADLIYVEELTGQPTQYQIILPLQKGKKIEISTQSQFAEREYLEIADSLNAYIFDPSKQIPPSS